MGASDLSQRLACFKAYDIRGQIPHQLNEEMAYLIGRGFVEFLAPAADTKIVVGYDIRNTSPAMCEALSAGLVDAGAQVLHIGQCGTEEVYFATAHLQAAGGVMITASHNPKDYNGMKLVREEARPISGDSGLKDIEAWVSKALQDGQDKNARGNKQGTRGQLSVRGDAQSTSGDKKSASGDAQSVRSAYIKHLLRYVDTAALKPLKIVCNAGNGGAGAIIDLLQPQLPFEFIKLHHEPDGDFPNGVPNPLLVENRRVTADAVKQHRADMGIAWDGDFDRCFFFDAQGRFIEGYYIVGLLAEAFLQREPGATIVHDPRLVWNTLDMVKAHGGRAVQCKAGHAFIKECMRAENAAYGGEMSAHHYFRDFFYCDSGMLPWLLIAEIMCRQDKPLAELVDARLNAYPISGEINRQVHDAEAVFAAVKAHYAAEAKDIDYTDGLSMDLGKHRINLRSSNTEPVVRVNVEVRAAAAKDQAQQLLQQTTDELLHLIDSTDRA